MRVRGVDFIYYPVADMPRAEAFYRGVLGLEPKGSYGDGVWVEFEAGGVTIALDASQSAPVASSGAGMRPAVALACEDVEAALQSARAAGAHVAAELIEVPGSCRFAVIADPDGNPIILHQRNDGTFG